MSNYLDELKDLGIGLPEILLPAERVDLHKWPVVACDQFTSEPEYWREVSDTVGDSPSTLHLILPEAYLGDDSTAGRISQIHETMDNYLQSGVLTPAPEGAYIIVRHLPDKPTRTGLMIKIDLDSYDYTAHSISPIRPTEGTIVERIPARKRIRTGAPVEVPHVMVLLDDPGKTVIEPLAQAALSTEPVYEIPLMKNGGAVAAYRITSPDLLSQMVKAFGNLADKEAFSRRYDSENPFYIAIGDGNHSLAAAKAYWEDLKSSLSDKELNNHPARYAMVEAVNIYDDGITFEPIHRLFFNIDSGKLLEHFMENGTYEKLTRGAPRAGVPEPGEIGFISAEEVGVIKLATGTASETTAAAQDVIDSFLSSVDCRIDFVHDLDRAVELGGEARNACCIMPKITKEEFFQFIVKNGCYPRKSFSMGESNEKRYYMEARIIRG